MGHFLLVVFGTESLSPAVFEMRVVYELQCSEVHVRIRSTKDISLNVVYRQTGDECHIADASGLYACTCQLHE